MKSSLLNILILAFLVVAASAQQEEELSESLLEFFPIINERFLNANIQYRAFIESSRTEYDLMIKIHQSRILSRIGFVVDEMRNIQNEVEQVIEDRAIEINNLESECILDSQRNLSSQAEASGNFVMLASLEWFQELNFLNDDLVNPVLQELDIIASFIDFASLDMFTYEYNAVTEIYNIVTTLYLQTLIYPAFFEIFVNEIIFEFGMFRDFTNEKNGRIFTNLQEIVDEFTLSTNLIRDNVANCNA
ncbi:CLUMA_CG008616, isoform A [Clunio marinus]|uniref:CLUMA_CG008616, isoform A n=1 Tax=Clunio marinus TaxID=568069 RepID=A0A1J1I5X3_9DIPT|nr:CLUMA_CG008616, isoform A [Clunio marinus]